jgi:membrane protein DedA with SNARE-associated domain
VGVVFAATLAALWSGRHATLFVWLAASGLGVPPGEDLLVASTGAMVAAGDLTWWVAIPMVIVAVVTSDTLLFSAGEMARSTLSGKAVWFADRILHYVESVLGGREAAAIAIARFVPGLRTIVFMSMGARGMPRARFLFIDACAAAAWASLVMTCGAALVSFLLGEEWLTLGAWR